MSESLIVEIWGEPAGFVVREGNAFRFHAVARPFFVLDGTQFTTLGHARLAAARLRPPRVRSAPWPVDEFAPRHREIAGSVH
ncbi:MAG: hypothetical protein JSR90_07550 [Proteobacteria bacterium]|nr:hypothetical protein [Pseudomonadota bacterium]